MRDKRGKYMENEMTSKEALLIAEEILKIIAEPKNHFAENMHDYICDKLDISDESLIQALDTISKLIKYKI